jgi:hypothetical protein
MVVLKKFSGRGCHQACTDAIARELQFDGRPLSRDTWMDGVGRILGRREYGDCYLMVELTRAEGLEVELAYCDGQAAQYADLATTWPAGHQLQAYNRKLEAEWRAKADVVRVRIEAEKGRAA